jgi:hypothetical protein
MADVVLFRSARELGAHANLQAFMDLCQTKLKVFGESLPFEKNTWDVTEFIPLKGKSGALRVVFSSWNSVNEAVPTPMPEPFLAFAKSYFRYQHGLRPAKAVGFRIAALRALCASLEEHGATSPVVADAGVFNRAAQILAAHYSPSAAYRIGQQLELVATFLDDNNLLSVPLQWRCPIPRPQETTGRVGKEFDKVRSEKLPSAFVLDSLARAFLAATEPPDVVITSIAAILCSAPDRVNEVLSLRADCEVRMERAGHDTAYGLRYWPSKGAEPMVKWVVPSMADVVSKAVMRLRTQSEEARLVATWYEAHPTSLFLPPYLEYLRGRTDLSMTEVMEVLFLEPGLGGADWCKRNAVPLRRRDRKLLASFADLEQAVVSQLPRGFPFMNAEVGLRYSEALCVMLRNAMHGQRGTYRCLIDAVDQGVLSTGLGNRSRHGVPSVFDRLGLFEPDGASVVIRSHQFRHYLNTLAQSGGMSELDIAKWSGRIDVRQNSAYNHVSDRDMLEHFSQLKAEDAESSTEVAIQARVSLLPRARFDELKIRSAHTTDLGFCVHDHAMPPCQLHLDCMNCNEQFCVKGDEVGEAKARSMLAETASLLREAQVADADGYYGASRWVRHQQLTLERLTELVSILDDPRIQKGAVIYLAHINPASRLEQATKERKALGASQSEEATLTWQANDAGRSE